MDLITVGIVCLSTALVIALGVNIRQSIKTKFDSVNTKQDSIQEVIEGGFRSIEEWGKNLQNELRRSQEDFRLETVQRITNDFNESNQNLLEKINNKFNEFQQNQISGLSESRKQQDTRLKEVETTLRESLDTLLASTAGHQKELMSLQKTQSEDITKALSGFQEKLTDSLTKLSEQQNQFSENLLRETSSQKEGVLSATKKQSDNLTRAYLKNS